MSMMIFAAAVAAQPLPPSGRWVVDYADSMCVLQRQFGSGADAVLFALRPYPIADTVEIVLVAADRSGPRVRRGTAQLTIAQSSTVSSDYVSVRLPGENKRLTAFSVKREELNPIAGAKTLTIVAGKMIATIAPTQVSAAMKALRACQDDLLEGWGVDTAAMAAIATPAEPVSPSIRWLTHNDYPTQAIRESGRGRPLSSGPSEWTVESATAGWWRARGMPTSIRLDATPSPEGGATSRRSARTGSPPSLGRAGASAGCCPTASAVACADSDPGYFG